MTETVPQIPSWVAGLLPLLIAWSIVWKGIALWKAARTGSKVWYVVLLLINTVGILEIIYIFAVTRKSQAGPRAQTLYRDLNKPLA